MKRVDIVDVKADIRDGALECIISDTGIILLKDTQSTELVCIGQVDKSWAAKFLATNWI